jgi:hypothetical protein
MTSSDSFQISSSRQESQPIQDPGYDNPRALQGLVSALVIQGVVGTAVLCVLALLK